MAYTLFGVRKTYFTPIYRGGIIFEYYSFVGTLRYQINAQITLDSYISDRYKLHFGSSVELQATLNLKVVGSL